MASSTVVEHVSHATNNLPFSSEEHIRQELQSLADELSEIEHQIAAVRATLYGLSVIYGPDVVGHDLLPKIRPARRAKRGGITEGCLLILGEDGDARPVAEICARLKVHDPELLACHRNPMASVMSVLRSLAARGRVMRCHKDGRSAWQLASGPDGQQTASATAPEYFQ